MTDLLLAIVHHVLVFSLAIMLGAEAILVRDGMRPNDAARVARLDIGYGATSGLIVIVGILRVIYGAKGSTYYVENVWFWAKMASFVMIGVLSIPPTLRFRKWAIALKTNPSFTPAAADISGVRFYLRFELRLLVLVVAFAATMARYYTKI